MVKKRKSIFDTFVRNLLGLNPLEEISEEVVQGAVVNKLDKDANVVRTETKTLTPSSKEEFFGENSASPVATKVTKSKDGKVITEETVKLEPSSEEEMFAPTDWLKRMRK